MNKLQRIINLIKNRIKFCKDKNSYDLLNRGKKLFSLKNAQMLMIYENEENAANVDMHYFLQDYYLAKKVINNSPEQHYDIGSRIDGFITHLLTSGVSVTLLDIRPFPIKLDNLSFIQADATELDGIEDESINSLSSLHAIEHFGLGRYGDEIDPYAWKKSLKSIQRKIKRGGKFYLGIPIGRKNKLVFNAHRIFNPETILKNLEMMELESFAYIHDYKVHEVDTANIPNCLSKIGDYDCGLFVFRKK